MEFVVSSSVPLLSHYIVLYHWRKSRELAGFQGMALLEHERVCPGPPRAAGCDLSSCPGCGLGRSDGNGTRSWDNPSLISPVTRPPERPDRPRDLELTDLAERSVRLTWIPGDDNNSPITGATAPSARVPPIPPVPLRAEPLAPAPILSSRLHRPV